jgi:hypothetical protein
MAERPKGLADALAREEEWPNWPVLPVVTRSPAKSGIVLPKLTQEDVQPEHKDKAVVFLLNMFAQPINEGLLRECDVEVFENWEAADAAGWVAD